MLNHISDQTFCDVVDLPIRGRTFFLSGEDKTRVGSSFFSPVEYDLRKRPIERQGLRNG